MMPDIRIATAESAGVLALVVSFSRLPLPRPRRYSFPSLTGKDATMPLLAPDIVIEARGMSHSVCHFIFTASAATRPSKEASSDTSKHSVIFMLP